VTDVKYRVCLSGLTSVAGPRSPSPTMRSGRPQGEELAESSSHGRYAFLCCYLFLCVFETIPHLTSNAHVETRNESPSSSGSSLPSVGHLLQTSLARAHRSEDLAPPHKRARKNLEGACSSSNPQTD
jgi:hypothetical protein